MYIKTNIFKIWPLLNKLCLVVWQTARCKPHVFSKILTGFSQNKVFWPQGTLFSGQDGQIFKNFFGLFSLTSFFNYTGGIVFIILQKKTKISLKASFGKFSSNFLKNSCDSIFRFFKTLSFEAKTESKESKKNFLFLKTRLVEPKKSAHNISDIYMVKIGTANSSKILRCQLGWLVWKHPMSNTVFQNLRGRFHCILWTEVGIRF